MPLLEISSDILASLAYFDLFDFPLTETELYSWLRRTPGHFAFTHALKQLLASDLIFSIDGFYLMRREPAFVRRRREGEKKAADLLRVAVRVSRWLALFPFVRGVAVSGSLSKRFADDQSDIDFFIVTAADRLWMARTALHLFKKLAFLVKREDYFCMNYFVDEAEPEITDKNIYTATEVLTLLPMAGESTMQSFFRANEWATRVLPNRKIPVGGRTVDSRFQRRLEKLMDFCGGDKLESWLMKTTASRWNKKTAASKKTPKGHILEMALSAHFSKPAANGFHDALMKRYQSRLDLIAGQRRKIATG